jgi:glycosyltransferase involved in cell wall biosynthesis
VFVDGFTLSSGRTTGWERYVQLLVAEMQRDDRGLDITVLEPKRGTSRLQWEEWDLPRFTSRLARSDLVHSPAAPPAPVIGRARRVLTVHDATFLAHPEWASRVGRVYYRHALKLALSRKSVRVVTPSASVQLDLHLCGVTPERVRVARPGVASSSAISPARPPHLPREVDSHFFLFVGTREPRKNLDTLLDAWLRMGQTSANLVLVGRAGWGTTGRLPPQVHLLGSINDSQLQWLYQNASALVAPSHYEGFGLPTIEALAHGTLVLASDIPVNREIAGAVAHYFLPTNTSALAGLLKAVIPRSLQSFDEQAARRAHAEQFTLRRFGDEMAEVYRWGMLA